MRAARPADAPELQRVLTAAYAPFLHLLGPDAPPLAQDIVADIAEGACLVAGDPPEGFAVFRHDGDAVHLENLAVDPRRQGKGRGRALVAEVEARGRDAGRTRLQLATSPALAATRAFYHRLGFTETAADESRVTLEKPL